MQCACQHTNALAWRLACWVISCVRGNMRAWRITSQPGDSCGMAAVWYPNGYPSGNRPDTARAEHEAPRRPAQPALVF